MENVKDGYNIGEFLDKITVDEFMEIYLQIVNALNVAYNMVNFTHYDLHLGNVLIQKLEEPVAIPIYLEDKIKYLVTKYMVKIIDYGTSYAKIQGHHFGNYSIPEIFYGEKPYQIYDVYKYLLFIGIECKKLTSSNSQNILNLVRYIYTLFNEYPEYDDRYIVYVADPEDYGIPIKNLEDLQLKNFLSIIYQEINRRNYNISILDNIPKGVKGFDNPGDADIFLTLANNISEIDNIIDFAITVEATYKLSDSVEKINLLRTIRNVNILELFNREVADVEQRIRKDSSDKNIREICFWTVAAHYALKYKKIEDKKLYAKIAEIAASTKDAFDALLQSRAIPYRSMALPADDE